MLPEGKLQQRIETGQIEIGPLAYMRGRTLSNAYVILDEAQNTTPSQMKMFLTRLGENSRMVITGDPTQSDLPPGMPSGLGDAVGKLRALKAVSVVQFEKKDVVRHPLVGEIIERIKELCPDFQITSEGFADVLNLLEATGTALLGKRAPGARIRRINLAGLSDPRSALHRELCSKARTPFHFNEAANGGAGTVDLGQAGRQQRRLEDVGDVALLVAQPRGIEGLRDPTGGRLGERDIVGVVDTSGLGAHELHGADDPTLGHEGNGDQARWHQLVEDGPRLVGRRPNRVVDQPFAELAGERRDELGDALADRDGSAEGRVGVVRMVGKQVT